MAAVHTITPFLRFHDTAEEAAAFYCGVFPNSRVVQVVRWPATGKQANEGQPGHVLLVAFELNGVAFTAMNGGPEFEFSPAVSFVVHCDTQAEIDHYWALLGAGGDPEAQTCGWLKDRYGLSWQIIPRTFPAMMSDLGSPAAGRVMAAMMGMKKLDQAALAAAFAG
jgi:predicted 3-demethylubiquinone-9 3-methyltransferase (glyoxalase superfamily)